MLMNATRLVISLFIGSLLLLSCSVEKRLYNKGFHVQKHHLLKQNEQEEAKSIVATTSFNSITRLPNDSILNESPKEPIPEIEQTDCDTIYLLNGEKVIGNVVIKNDRYVIIDDCKAQAVKNPTVFLKDIEAIHYDHGGVENINEMPIATKEALEKMERKKQRQVRPLFYIGLSFLIAASILFVFTWAFGLNFSLMIYMLYFLIAAFVLSIISMVYHAKRKSKLGTWLSFGQLFIAFTAFIATVLFMLNNSF